MTPEELKMMRQEFHEFQKNIFYEVMRQRVIASVEEALDEGMTGDDAVQHVLNTWATDIYTMMKEHFEEGEVD